MSSRCVGLSRRALLALAALAPLAAVFAASPAADAAPKHALVELRVEGPDGALDPGTWYVTGKERIRRSRPSDACKRRTGRTLVPGPSPLALVQTASRANRALNQVRVRRDEAGLFVCESACVRGRDFTHPDGFAGWTYYVNDEFASAPADQLRLRRGDRVLWIYNDFGPSPVNTGPRLELRRVPAGTTEQTVEVRVTATDFMGVTQPATGVQIEGAQAVSELGNGWYEVQIGRGFTNLRAEHSAAFAVPSAPVRVCSRPRAAACPRAHGRTIHGSNAGDRIKGTRGWDRIIAGAGNDRINLRQPGRDRVNCGPGRDAVVIKRGDRDKRIAKSCERVIRRR